jgi:hypothetical protein
MSLNQKNFPLYGKKNNLFKNLKLKLINLSVPLLVMTGWGREYTIEPERLPVAYVGKVYNQQLKTISKWGNSKADFKIYSSSNKGKTCC